MNKELSIIQLSYGDYVSLDDYLDLKKKLEAKNKIIDEVIEIIKKEYFVKYNGELVKRFLFDTPYEILEILERGKNGK